MCRRGKGKGVLRVGPLTPALGAESGEEAWP